MVESKKAEENRESRPWQLQENQPPDWQELNRDQPKSKAAASSQLRATQNELENVVTEAELVEKLKKSQSVAKPLEFPLDSLPNAHAAAKENQE